MSGSLEIDELPALTELASTGKGLRWDVVVIGAGANGLIAAAILGRAGLRVLVVEGAETVGGQARTLEFAPGFRAAPLALDAGWVLPEAAHRAGITPPERLQPEAPLSVIVEPGAALTLARDPARAAEAIRGFSPSDAVAWPGFVARLREGAAVLEALYRRPPPAIDAKLREMLPLLGIARRVRRLGRAGMTALMRTLPMSVQELLDDRFEHEGLKAAVGAGGVVDLRQGPRSGGTAFVLLHHLVGAAPGTVRGRGVWRAGPDALVKAAHEAALSAGVIVRTGSGVTRILVDNDAVRGVQLEGGEVVEALRILSTSDPARTLLAGVDPVWLDPEFVHAARQIKYRGSTAYVLYALDSLPEIDGLAPEALAGIVSLTPTLEALEQAADAAKYGAVSERPHVEIALPTVQAPEAAGLAPAGQHVLVARVRYAPSRLSGDATWDAARRDALVESVTSALVAVDPGFASRIVERAGLTPLDLEREYGLTEGAASHGELTLDQILFMRPVPGWSRYAMPIRGLYLGGSGAHPGPGIPGGAGWLAAQRLIHDHRRG